MEYTIIDDNRAKDSEGNFYVTVLGDCEACYFYGDKCGKFKAYLNSSEVYCSDANRKDNRDIMWVKEDKKQKEIIKERTIILVSDSSHDRCSCDKCIFDSFNCDGIQKKLNLNCLIKNGKQNYFTIKKTFHPCTKENTKVNDEVYLIDKNIKYKVEYIMKKKNIMVVSLNGNDQTVEMDRFQVEV